jgi:hypothetical protein
LHKVYYLTRKRFAIIGQGIIIDVTPLTFAMASFGCAQDRFRAKHEREIDASIGEQLNSSKISRRAASK